MRISAIAAAYWAHTPVVAIMPETGSVGVGLGGFQDTDELPIFSKITKYQAHVSSPERIAELTARAFSIAMLERGPTQLNIPRDHFYGEFDTEIPQPAPIERRAGGTQSLEAAAELLANAKFPVIMAGGGIVMGGGQAEAIVLAEHLSAPVITSYLHNDAFPASHRLACGPLGYRGSKAAMRIVEKADVVLALGSRLGPYGTLPQYGMDYWPKRKCPVLDQAEARLNEIAEQKKKWEAELDKLSSGTGTPVEPRRALRELEKAIPADAMVATDIGNIYSTSNSYLRFDRPNSFLQP